MIAAGLPPAPRPDLQPRALGPADAPLLQRLFDASEGYFRIVQRHPAGPDEARETLAGDPPAGMPFERRWPIGYADADGALGAYADVVAGLLSPAVCHVGLFVVAPARHGRGDAQAILRSLEDWARAAGARWMRLGVVTGNTRGERFWARQGFLQTRTRPDPFGNEVRVLFKPLAGGTQAEYLALVERDRPETP